ncbi:SERAC1 [Bugula neritina]|uniref:SERAC1 n=1 Tax=Bugula neritina TaxID=10212 RepID=A0A7J7IUT2_BUGNE|nr:SERAC1 [Bugula neritina]
MNGTSVSQLQMSPVVAAESKDKKVEDAGKQADLENDHEGSIKSADKGISDESKQPKMADESSATESYRYDVVLWLFGMLFFSLLVSLMFGIGSIRGWDADSAYNHNMSNSSMERFLPEPFTPEPGVYKR